MFVILKNPETGETICTDEPEGEGLDFEYVGQTDRLPKEGEIWDEISADWVTDEEAKALEVEREWNDTFKTIRAKFFEYEARIHMLEQEAMSRRAGND